MAKEEVKAVEVEKEEVVEQEVSLSAKERRAQYEALIAAYKKANPVKYASKKEELERKLAAIK